jgi:putative ABC transport system permease protein
VTATGAALGRRMRVRRTDIAWRNLVRDKTRLAISVGGVGFAVMLIVTLRALYAGVIDQATQYIRSVDADAWVAQAGTPGDFFHSMTLIPESTGQRIADVPGVTRVSPFVGRPVVFRHGGDDQDFFLVGIDPESGVGGPPDIREGSSELRPGSLIVDHVFARNTDVDLGDRIELEGRSLTVSGIASGGNSVFSQFAWTTLDDAVAVLGARDIVNYFLVDAAGEEEPESLASRIDDQVDGVHALTEDEFLEKNLSDLREGFLPIVWMLVLIAFAIGAAVIGLTIYTATLEKRREYGVLKAIGFSNRRLVGIVCRQSLVAGAMGFVLGLVIAVVLGALLERALPIFVTSFRVRDVALVAALAVGMSAVSSLIPIRPVTRLDPAQVFRV